MKPGPSSLAISSEGMLQWCEHTCHMPWPSQYREQRVATNKTPRAHLQPATVSPSLSGRLWGHRHDPSHQHTYLQHRETHKGPVPFLLRRLCRVDGGHEGLALQHEGDNPGGCRLFPGSSGFADPERRRWAGAIEQSRRPLTRTSSRSTRWPRVLQGPAMNDLHPSPARFLLTATSGKDRFRA